MTDPEKLRQLALVHAGHPGALVENRPGGLAFKCKCNGRLIDLGALFLGAGSTSTSKGLPDEPTHPPKDLECPKHLGEWARSCGRCRSDAIAATDQHPKVAETRTGVAPTDSYLEARARLEAKLAAKARDERVNALDQADVPDQPATEATP